MVSSPSRGWTKGDVLWIRPGREASGAIFVLRKALGTAVQRNKLRRRLRHLCRSLALSERAGSLVIFPQKGATSVPFSVLGTELDLLVARLSGDGL